MVRSTVWIDLEIISMSLIGSRSWSRGKKFGSTEAPTNIGQRCGNGFQAAETISKVQDQWKNMKGRSKRCDLQIKKGATVKGMFVQFEETQLLKEA